MKTNRLSTGVGTLLVLLGMAAGGAAAAFGQDAVYSARVASQSDTNWDFPFYWINVGDYTPYNPSTEQSSATQPVSTPSRIGSYVHTARLMSVGGGFGLVHIAGTNANAIYEVQITQPGKGVAPDIIMNVGSTNGDLGGVFGATAGGGWTNTTAFQRNYSSNQWAFTCYLTNRPGVTQPHIDFKYVSGGTGSDRTYADCVRFHQIGIRTNVPSPVRITRLAGASLDYTGGAGARFVLLQSPSLPSAPANWQRLATNTATPGSFSIPPAGAAAAAFYCIQAE